MLVLSRKLNESIELFFGGQHVGTISVADIQTGKVRIAVKAVDQLRVVRSEIEDFALQHSARTLQPV